jgi:hypothetical protein
MYDVEDENRFWSKILTGEIDECWECVGMWLGKDGYGSLRVNGGRIKTHRFSFQLFHNRLIKDKMFICHKCDNRKCVNPNHLFEGTQQDNMIDMMNKGRGNKAKGEKITWSKLTEAKVKEIRTKYNKKTKITLEVLAKEYGVDYRVIHDIIKRKTWKHVE